MGERSVLSSDLTRVGKFLTFMYSLREEHRGDVMGVCHTCAPPGPRLAGRLSRPPGAATQCFTRGEILGGFQPREAPSGAGIPLLLTTDIGLLGHQSWASAGISGHQWASEDPRTSRAAVRVVL
ncbi:hypothetical protein RRG08_014054 [Elysia crispata]|uniref:Uncharacterized protein n=1 Tax=Elysia crispata TaxID=231223 RepID=A0AAE1DQ00_9GAST|nr:hypothetical protein RRG08_014054 [Elysia crispata]